MVKGCAGTETHLGGSILRIPSGGVPKTMIVVFGRQDWGPPIYGTYHAYIYIHISENNKNIVVSMFFSIIPYITSIQDKLNNPC